jgi:hypothetical protein
MDPSFWLKLGLGFAVGSAWVTLTTLAAERYGSRIGGLIGGLPSTALVSLLFIGLTQTPQAAAEAATVIPLVQGINALFVIVYLRFVRRGLVFGLTSALLAWFVLTSILVVSGLRSVWLSVAGWLLLAAASYLAVERYMTIPSHGRVHASYAPAQIAYRALFGGTVIAFAVLMGKLGGPVYGGVFATFPAMFLSTLAVTYRAGGVEFSRAVAKALMISGLINVPLYAIVVRWLYPELGLIVGTAIALAFSYCTGYLTYLFMRVKLS